MKNARGRNLAFRKNSPPLVLNEQSWDFLKAISNQQFDYFSQFSESEIEEGLALFEKLSLITREGDGSPAVLKRQRKWVQVDGWYRIRIPLVRNFHPGQRVSRIILLAIVSYSIVATVTGICVTALNLSDILSVWSTPVTLINFVTIFLAIPIISSFHELAHAFALRAFGGRVGSMGFMLFYLSPAFYCDVSESWGLKSKNQQAIVAAAGSIFSLGIAATLMLLSASTGYQHIVLTYISCLVGVGAITNVIPLIELDGYFALAALLDKPNMRPTSIELSQVFLANTFLGEEISFRNLGRALYGVLCWLTPLVILFSFALYFSSISTSWLNRIVAAALGYFGLFLFFQHCYGIWKNMRSKSTGIRNFLLFNACTWALIFTIIGSLTISTEASAPFWCQEKKCYLVKEDTEAFSLENSSAYSIGLLGNERIGGVELGDKLGELNAPANIESPSLLMKSDGYPVEAQEIFIDENPEFEDFLDERREWAVAGELRKAAGQDYLLTRIISVLLLR